MCHVHTVESLWRELHLAALCLTVSTGKERDNYGKLAASRTSSKMWRESTESMRLNQEKCGVIFFVLLIKKMSNEFVNVYFTLYKPASHGIFVYCSGSLSD